MTRARSSLPAVPPALTLVAALAGCSPPGGSPPHAPAADLGTRVDAILAPLVAANEFSGAVVLMRDGEVVYRRGFGMANHREGIPFTPETPVDGASLAKTFTAAGVRLLAAEGRIALEAPVARYLPEYPHPRTTVTHLLSHSNGLPADYGFFEPLFAAGEVWTTEAMLRLTGEHAPEPSFEPGSRYEYSNLGFDAAGLLIERVSGRDYEGFMRERFFEPAGMTGSFARPARLSEWEGPRTEGYAWVEGAWVPNDALDLEAFFGASNLYFTADDLARWGEAQVRGTALPEAIVQAGLHPLEFGGAGLPMTGLAWYCDERQVRCNYSGHHAGFHDFLHWDRERREVAVFVSNSTLPAWRIATLQRDLVRVLSGAAPEELHTPTFVPAADLEPEELAGRYEAIRAPVIELTAGDGGLHLRLAGGAPADAYPAGPQVLYVPGYDAFLGFALDGTEPVLHLRSVEVDAVARRSGR